MLVCSYAFILDIYCRMIQLTLPSPIRKEQNNYETSLPPSPFPSLPSPWWTAVSTALTPDPVSMSHVQFPWSRNNVYLLVGCHFRFLVFLCDGPEGSLPLQLLENSQHDDLILSLQKNDNLILRLQRNATKR